MKKVIRAGGRESTKLNQFGSDNTGFIAGESQGRPAYRIYSLWDQVRREDVLRLACRRCRANGGAPDYDGESFRYIEEYRAEG